MDMNAEDLFKTTKEFFSVLVSSMGLKYRDTILDIGPNFRNCALQLCIAQCFYFLFMMRKLSKRWIAILTIPLIILVVIPAIAVGKYIPIVTLLCWGVIVLVVHEAVALVMLIIFITLFTVSEMAVAIYAFTSYCVLGWQGMFQLADSLDMVKAFIYVSIAMIINQLCIFHQEMNEIFAVPIYIALFYQTALIYLPDISHWYLYVAGNAYFIHLMIHLYNYLVVEPWAGNRSSTHFRLPEW